MFMMASGKENHALPCSLYLTVLERKTRMLAKEKNRSAMPYRKEAERIMIAVGSDKMNFKKLTLNIEQGFLNIKDNVHSLKNIFIS